MHAEHRPDRQRFLHDILANRYNRAILDAWDALELPDAWLVAGCLFQTVWNLECGRAPEDGIKDYDIFYFDGGDLSAQAEMRRQVHVDRVLGPLGAPIEVKNQARVHLWYEEHFGYPYEKLANAKEGLYAGVLTPNPLVPHVPLFREKAASYRNRWGWLQVAEAP